MKPLLVLAALCLASCGGADDRGGAPISSSSAPATSFVTTSASGSASPTTPSTTVTVTSTTVREGLRVADASAPTGDCADFEIRGSVFVVLGGTTQAGTAGTCTKVAPSQTLLLANPSNQTVSIAIGGHTFDVPPLDRDYPSAGRAGDLLAPGVHRLGDRELWLVGEPTTRLPAATIGMGSYGPLALGFTVRDAQRVLGVELAIDPQFRGWDGHPITIRPSTVPPFATATLSTYDASVPTFALRARGSNPLDAQIVWISPRASGGRVPDTVQVGWTIAQVRAVYSTRLVTPSGIQCPRPDSTILAVYDGAPVTGTTRLWFVFDHGLLTASATSTVDLADTGRLDC